MAGDDNRGHEGSEVNNVDQVASRNTVGIGRLSDGMVRARSTRSQFRDPDDLNTAARIVDSDHNDGNDHKVEDVLEHFQERLALPTGQNTSIDYPDEESAINQLVI